MSYKNCRAKRPFGALVLRAGQSRTKTKDQIHARGPWPVVLRLAARCINAHGAQCVDARCKSCKVQRGPRGSRHFVRQSPRQAREGGARYCLLTPKALGALALTQGLYKGLRACVCVCCSGAVSPCQRTSGSGAVTKHQGLLPAALLCRCSSKPVTRLWSPACLGSAPKQYPP
jgi:hypothetical protein